MTRSIAEQINRLSVFFLKKHKYLPQGESQTRGGVIWSSRDRKNDIDVVIKTSGNEKETIETSYAELIYTVSFRSSGEKIDMRHKIPLTTTPCNYGGKRYWFICPLIKDGKYCGRRVGVVYNVSKYFGCRRCANVAYRAQFEGGKFRIGSITEPEVEKARSEVRRAHYNNKPTRKYRRYLRIRKKMDDGWTRMLMRYAVKYKNIV